LKEDASLENRKEAALALGLVGRNSDLAKQGLREALHDPEAAVRDAAQLALSFLNRPLAKVMNG
jgi:hypothetical protein